MVSVDTSEAAYDDYCNTYSAATMFWYSKLVIAAIVYGIYNVLS